MVAGDAVLQAVHTTGIGGHIATDRRDHLTAGIRYVGMAKTMFRQGLFQILINHPWLDHRKAVYGVNFQHPVHMRQLDHDAAMGRNRAPANRRARTASNIRLVVLLAPGDQLRHLLGRLRKHHGQQIPTAKHRGIITIHGALCPGRQHVGRSNNGFKCLQRLDGLHGRPFLG